MLEPNVDLCGKAPRTAVLFWNRDSGLFHLLAWRHGCWFGDNSERDFHCIPVGDSLEWSLCTCAWWAKCISVVSCFLSQILLDVSGGDVVVVRSSGYWTLLCTRKTTMNSHTTLLWWMENALLPSCPNLNAAIRECGVSARQSIHFALCVCVCVCVCVSFDGCIIGYQHMSHDCLVTMAKGSALEEQLFNRA